MRYSGQLHPDLDVDPVTLDLFVLADEWPARNYLVRLMFLQQEEAFAFEAEGRLSFVHTKQGRLDVDLSLTSLETILGPGYPCAPQPPRPTGRSEGACRPKNSTECIHSRIARASSVLP